MTVFVVHEIVKVIKTFGGSWPFLFAGSHPTMHACAGLFHQNLAHRFGRPHVGTWIALAGCLFLRRSRRDFSGASVSAYSLAPGACLAQVLNC